MKTLYTACLGLSLTFGCSEEPKVNPLIVEDISTTAKLVEAPKTHAAASTSRTTAGAKAGESTRCSGGLAGIVDGGWLGEDNPNGWEGTGHEDPEEYKSISNEDMLAMARSASDMRNRTGALVSIGRRRAPGAMEVFKANLDDSVDIEIRAMSLTGLMEHGGPDALAMFWNVLENNSSARLRGKAIWGIAAYTANDAERAIKLGIEDDDKTFEVQGMALLATWALNDRPEVILPLLEEAMGSNEQRIWQEAANVLQRLPYSDAGNALELGARNATTKAKQRQVTAGYRGWLRQFPDLCK